MIKRCYKLALSLGVAMVTVSGIGESSKILAVEYQGQTLDGQKFEAKAYSHGTGGTFDVQVQFKKKRATLYFENGSKQTIWLDSREIQDPQEITGWGRPFGVRLGGFFNASLSDNRNLHNLEPTGLSTFEGLWSISLEPQALNENEAEEQADPERAD